MNQTISSRLANKLVYLLVFILVAVPFHEFITTWLGSNYGHLNLFRIWKEIVLILMFPPALYLLSKSKPVKKWVRNSLLSQLILLYTLLTITLGIWAYHSGRVNASALEAGIIIDLRMFLIFGLAIVLTQYSTFIKDHWRVIILAPGIITVLFGITQLFLPLNFLSHFGYGPKTIPAYETVNQNLNYRRIMSTLRGADPFGTYLILVISAFLVGCTKRWAKWLGIALSVIALFFTYSRSAWLGLVISLIFLAYFVWVSEKYKKVFYVGLVILGLLGILFIFALRYNQEAQNIFFHTSSGSKAISSNAQHFSALKNGVSDLIHHPLGQGPGTAGPASAHNNHPAKIAENYYVQVGQEEGWLGLLLFIAINILVYFELLKRRKDSLVLVLLVSFVGISFVNMLSHAWADDTISLLWWGLAGVVLSPDIIKLKLKDKNEKTESKKQKRSNEVHRVPS